MDDIQIVLHCMNGNGYVAGELTDYTLTSSHEQTTQIVQRNERSVTFREQTDSNREGDDVIARICESRSISISMLKVKVLLTLSSFSRSEFDDRALPNRHN